MQKNAKKRLTRARMSCIIHLVLENSLRSVAQLGSARALGAWGRRFESCQSDSEASHPSFGWRTTRHRRATYPKKSTAMRMWCSGSTPASQAGNRGFEPRHPLYPENQNNGSDPTMGLVTVLSMWTLPEKTWTNSPGMGTHRQGREHASRLGSSEEEQVPFKHWVRIS